MLMEEGEEDDDERESEEEEREEEGDGGLIAEEGGEKTQGEEGVQELKKAPWTPFLSARCAKEVYQYCGQEITIYESFDTYGAVMWPGAVALSSYMESNWKKMDLLGKKVLELGSGTGLVAIVATLLGASVTATDLPDVLGNLRANVMRNTRGRCRYTPEITELSWGENLESSFPRPLQHYDYVLAGDVVYHHDFLDQLLATMEYFCKTGTTLIWANRVRFKTDLTFTENFKRSFHTELLLEDGDMKIYQATCRDRE